MLDSPSSRSGKRRLEPTNESPSIRASRNAFRPRTKRVFSTKKESLSRPSTISRPSTLSACPASSRKDELEPLNRVVKRSRTEDQPISTPDKARKLSGQHDDSPLSTPGSARYDSGIEMTPESTLEVIDARPQSPCEQKYKAKLNGHESDFALFARDPVGRTKKAAMAHSNARRRSPRAVHQDAHIDNRRSQGDCTASAPCPSAEITASDRTGEMYTEALSSGIPESRSPDPSSHHQHYPNATTPDAQLTWQPYGSKEDVTALLSILGETVVQQQRKKTVLQRWLRSHDDHRMFWLNYGGSSSPSDYLRWTKRVSPNCNLEDV